MTPHHLVIQSPALASEHCEQVAALSQAQGLVRLSATAARLLDVQHDDATRQEVRQWCESAGVDHAFMAKGSRLAQCKVLVMDMDSTLINIECIDEIADIAGVKDKVAAITEAAMRGEITDFAESLRRRVALLAGLPAQALEEVYRDRLKLNPGAETLIATARGAGLKVLLVSGGFTFFTERLRERLGLDDAQANVLDIQDGKLTGRLHGDIIDAAGKADRLRAFAQRHGAAPAHIIAMGDGANDLKMLGAAGYSVAYHAKPVVRQQTRYALNVSGLDGVLNWFEN
jgi:phosphoserine phosphatase